MMVNPMLRSSLSRTKSTLLRAFSTILPVEHKATEIDLSKNDIDALKELKSLRYPYLTPIINMASDTDTKGFLNLTYRSGSTPAVEVIKNLKDRFFISRSNGGKVYIQPLMKNMVEKTVTTLAVLNHMGVRIDLKMEDVQFSVVGPMKSVSLEIFPFNRNIKVCDSNAPQQGMSYCPFEHAILLWMEIFKELGLESSTKQDCAAMLAFCKMFPPGKMSTNDFFGMPFFKEQSALNFIAQSFRTFPYGNNVSERVFEEAMLLKAEIEANPPPMLAEWKMKYGGSLPYPEWCTSDVARFFFFCGTSPWEEDDEFSREGYARNYWGVDTNLSTHHVRTDFDFYNYIFMTCFRANVMMFYWGK